ncbi:nucleotide-diphospho-sugar transferase [Dendrothele bispora CBS 962.96]|uniref:Nucleotide-diphospho-sugar transferase n=1 Tax=Dendrothele bispora (strain CBS 962.96) TaxID=1314807 RepID=A0A4S8MP81_DENBC|nr:nucleotide-diphospho-sugar transferase [Dendrothele bispora CBS 962.96]
MSFSRFFSFQHSYERLPVHTKSRLSPQNYRKLVVAASIFGGICVVWLLAKFLSYKAPYTPLDNYEHLNILPLLRDQTPLSSSSQRGVFSSLYSDSFAIAVAVLGHSVRRANIDARLILPYLSCQVSSNAICIVKAAGWEPHAVPLLPPPHNGRGIHARFRDQYTKLRIWSLGEELGIDSAVYFDADTLVLRNFEEPFNIPWEFGATPDIYRPGDDRGFAITFNAGVLAFRRSKKTFEDMKQKLETANYPLEQAEQAFLNLYFGAKALRLPYVYNANIVVKERSLEMWEELKEEARVIHYSVIEPSVSNVDPKNQR